MQIHLSWIVNLEYTCLNFYMEKLFSLKAFGQNSSPVHLECSLALMLQRGYWDLGTLCTCPFSNPLTHNVMSDGGQIETPAISIEAWLHRMNKNCFFHSIWLHNVGERIGKGAWTEFLGPSSLVVTSKRGYILNEQGWSSDRKLLS